MTTLPTDRPFRLLFLCTGNSARSQMAEAVLNRKGRGRFLAESAGSRPAPLVNPIAIATLQANGYAWTDRLPRGLDAVLEQSYDFVITVCDRAREACPVFPGQPVIAHWGMPDPADTAGTEQDRRAAFDDAFMLINRRIDLLLALPLAKIEKLALQGRINEIGGAGVAPAMSGVD